MGLATFRKRQKLRLHHILRLLIGVLIAITTIVILRHTLAEGMEFLDTHNIIHYYHIPEEEVDALIIDPEGMLSALTIVYSAFLAFLMPLSYILGVPRYFMIFSSYQYTFSFFGQMRISHLSWVETIIHITIIFAEALLSK